MEVSVVYITSSSPISEELKPVLEAKLVAKFGSSKYVYKVDSSLLAGMTIQHEDKEYSFDLNSQIQYIFTELLKN